MALFNFLQLLLYTLTIFFISQCSFDTTLDEAQSKHDKIEWHSQKAPWQNSRLLYVKTGTNTGPLLVFIHGSPGGWGAWIDYLGDKQLNGKMQLLAIDRPGYGGSSPGMATGSLEKQAQAVRAILNHHFQKQASNHNIMKRPPVILIGHSLGGPIAVRFAMDFPEQIDKLILIASPADPNLEEWVWFNRMADTSLIRLILPRDWDVSNQELKPLKQELSDIENQYIHIQCPVLILHGKADSLVPFANVKYLQHKLSHLQNMQIQTPDGEDHFLIWTRQKEVSRMLIEFIKGNISITYLSNTRSIPSGQL